MTVRVSVTDPSQVNTLPAVDTLKLMAAAVALMATKLIGFIVTVGRAVTTPALVYAHRVDQTVDASELVLRTLHWCCQKTYEKYRLYSL